MQNKLNEILELCIEKSDEQNGVFYEFRYKTFSKSVSIYKYNNGCFVGSIGSTINEVLKHMQNE